jgi:hypothetical protein
MRTVTFVTVARGLAVLQVNDAFHVLPEVSE